MNFLTLRRNSVRTVALLLLLTSFGFLVMGYHPGAEDDGVYVTGVKSDLNSALYPHDADFFKPQLKATVFDKWVAEFVRRTGMPVAWTELLWQFASLFAIVAACWMIISQLFEEERARWAGIFMLTSMFTLPVAGTALYIADQYLHPRAMSTALILFAAARIMSGAKRWQAIPFLVTSFALHPLMGALGISFCCALTLTFTEPVYAGLRVLRERLIPARVAPEAAAPFVALIPFAWLADPPSKTWLKALGTRHWFRLYSWTWYEWLGAIGPLVIFWVVSRVARKKGEAKLARLADGILAYGVFQQAVAMVLLGPRQLMTLSTLEPMRYLQLVYVFLTLIGGAYIGKYLLKGNIWRWAVFIVAANAGMFAAQRQLFAGTEHLEMPGIQSRNPWLQAFAWVRENTPTDAYFAMDPNYMAEPGEDYHSFRALAERSQLADGIKDTSVVSKIPEIGPVWERQVDATAGWREFRLADFQRLKRDFGVNWVIVNNRQMPGLSCRWNNIALAVCEIP